MNLQPRGRGIASAITPHSMDSEHEDRQRQDAEHFELEESGARTVNALVRATRDTSERFARNADTLTEIVVFSFAALFALVAIVEVTARNKTLVLIEIRQKQVLADLVKLDAATPADAPLRAALKSRAETLDVLDGELRVLILNGSTYHNVVGQILRAVVSSTGGYAFKPQGNEQAEQQLARVPSPLVSWVMAPQRLVELMSSEHLVALAVAMGGVVGTFIGNLRAGRRQTPRNLVLGLATGLIVFFALRGGRSVFLLEASATEVIINPYSACFAALIAGLFSERAYALLTSLVDAVAQKVEGLISNEPGGG